MTTTYIFIARHFALLLFEVNVEVTVRQVGIALSFRVLRSALPPSFLLRSVSGSQVNGRRAVPWHLIFLVVRRGFRLAGRVWRGARIGGRCGSLCGRHCDQDVSKVFDREVEVVRIRFPFRMSSHRVDQLGDDICFGERVEILACRSVVLPAMPDT